MSYRPRDNRGPANWNAVSYGNDCVIDGFLQFHSFENMTLKVKRTHIQEHTVAFGAIGGAVIERDTTLLQCAGPQGDEHDEGSPAEPVSGTTLQTGPQRS